MLTEQDAANIAHLAEAYRHKGQSAYADAVIAGRHLDFSPEVCRLALAEVLVEAEALRIVLHEMQRVLTELGGGAS